MTDQSNDNPRPDEDPAEGKPDLQPDRAPGSRSPGKTDTQPATGGEGAKGGGGPGGFGTGG